MSPGMSPEVSPEVSPYMPSDRPSGARSLAADLSYSLDAANFLSILTGDEFYVSRHRDAYGSWVGRISPAARHAIDYAVSIMGSAMLGPRVSYLISMIPGFEQMNLGELLGRTDEMERRAAAAPDYDPDAAARELALMQALIPAVEDLEASGFREYWTRERVPIIMKSISEIEKCLAGLEFDPGSAVESMLGRCGRGGCGDRGRDSRSGEDADAPIAVYVCSFAAPHGMRIFGRRFATDARYEPTSIVRIAVHEMFHPPYCESDVAEEIAALTADPLFEHSFATKDPKSGYSERTGFLEENVVEAMELHVTTGAGLMDDPVKYLLEHDGGSHRLSVVLLKYFNKITKDDVEPFGSYFRRVVSLMPVGDLQKEYDSEIESWRLKRADRQGKSGKSE